ncbi:MAG: hypothetical protein AAGD43_25780 [Pseudomonadota bacterium]
MDRTTFENTGPLVRARLQVELRVSRHMLRHGIDVVPRFIMTGASGNRIVILTSLATTGEKREKALDFLSAFMAFQMCASFVMAFQTINPQTLTGILVSRDCCRAATQQVYDVQQVFGEIVFHDPRHTDIDILGILPRKQSQLCHTTVDCVRKFMSAQEIAPSTYALEL